MLRRVERRNMTKLKTLIAAISCSLIIGTGYASWNFSESDVANNDVGVIVGKFSFRQEWTNSNVLPENTYKSTLDFEYAINNPNTPEGQAWTKAWSEKNTLGNSYVGSMDNRSDDDLDVVFNYEDANIIIKRRNNNEYDIYITYEALNRATGTVQPVYRTKFVRNTSTNVYEPTQSWVGRCNRNTYSVLQLGTYGFDTESFVAI